LSLSGRIWWVGGVDTKRGAVYCGGVKDDKTVKRGQKPPHWVWVLVVPLGIVGLVIGGIAAIEIFVPFQSFNDRASVTCSPLDYFSINGDIFCYTLADGGSIDKLFPR